MGVGQQKRVEKTYIFTKSKDAENQVLQFEIDLENDIDSYITDLVKKYPTVDQETLKTIAQGCNASIPADYSATLTQETNIKLKNIAEIDADYYNNIKPCTSSPAPLLPACEQIKKDAEAKLNVVISDSEQKLAGLKARALSSSKTYLDTCFSDCVSKSTSH